ncbi:MAG: ATP-binding protein [Deltaproteobacteria bacterium]|nr:ATP-binding protein [Deltaproteobacteria bacterium]MBW2121695.1 ATP-binding protein [Deltaproteobacteria bacterium]
MDGYEESLDHLLMELHRIALLIRAQVVRFRATGQAAMDEFRGLCIREEDVDAILARRGPFETREQDVLPGLTPLRDELASLERRISERRTMSLRNGTLLRLERLRELFDLTEFDVDLLLVCLMPELDLRYERLYAYLQDDVTKRRPGVDLAIQLLCPSFEARLTARRRFAPRAPLIKHRLVELFDDPSNPRPTLLGRYIKIDERVVEYLLGSDEPDTRLLPYARLILPRASLEDLLLPTHVKRRLRGIGRQKGPNGKGPVLYLQGPYGVGKQVTAEAVCRELGLRLLVVDGRRLLQAENPPLESALAIISREVRLQGAALYWAGFDALLADDKRPSRDLLIRELEDCGGLAFLAGETSWEPVDALHETPFVRVESRRPGYAERLHLWTRLLRDTGTTEAGLDLRALANRFALTGGQIRDALATARNLARWRNPENGHVTTGDLYRACRLHSNRRLAVLAHKIKPRYLWDDIILPEDRRRQLREICNCVKYRSLVYEDWGFDQKLSLGKGLNVLFAGPSGTGKTMAAEIMAQDLGLDLYKIDLSGVVSKYIGETEKNLARIFAEAETSNAILFFDEADALFGKRSEVRDSHDRYANVEISYLLQRMEEYEGVVILATNLRKNMDDAFVRRMHFAVEFPFPGERDRRRIWEGIWPEQTPLSQDLDLDFMARQFEIAGGNIRNVAVAASFLAADEGGVLNMSHLIRATRREYQKMGKVLSEGEFGRYARLAETR